jgi:precorrin-2 dehydrogenase/sirohydrochlorin ferrochelatase
VAGFRYPVSLEVSGRRCVVVGGGVVAEHKARSLLEAGAEVVVVAETVTPGVEELAAGGLVSVVRRAYAAGDLEGAFLAVAATDDPGVNAGVYEEGERARVLVNSVDDVEHCHFAVPSVVRRGELTLSIATGGKAPALAKMLRRKLSEQFGPEYAEVVELIGDVRREAQAQRRQVDFDTWVARWEQGLESDIVGLVRAGRRQEARARLLAALAGPRDFVNEGTSP